MATLAYGFVGIDNLFADRITDSNVQIVRDAITSSVAEHNRQVAAIIAEFVEPTVEYKVRFKGGVGGTLQPLDEFGIPKPVRGGTQYDVAFPIQGGGTAWGDNRVTRALMTVQDVNEYTLMALKQDADWMKRHIMAAILDNTSWNYVDPLHGTLAVQPLANGDSVEFVRKNGTSSTDNHYIAQAGAVADGSATNPFPTIYDELSEHPENDGATIVAYIPTNIKSAVTGLTNFIEVPDSNISYGDSVNSLSGVIDRGFGDEVLGKVDKVWVVEWSNLPDNYIMAVARGAQPALRMRQYDAGSLQGFFQEENSPDGNLQEHRFIRYAGFGSYNRVGALAYFVSAGDTTYDIPAAYTTPLAVQLL